MLKYITIKNEQDLKTFLTSIDGIDVYDIEIDLCENSDYSKEHDKILDMIFNNTKLFQDNIHKLDFKVPYEKIPKKEFIKLYKIYTALNNDVMMGVNVEHWFSDGKSYDWIDDKEILNSTQRWDIKTIIKANLEINKVCDFVKRNNLSPMEAFAFVHNYVSTISKYNPTNDLYHSWRDKDQFFAGAFMDLPEVVCAGYSSLMKEIIDSLGISGLQCEIISLPFENMLSGITGSHARCFIKVKDDKYGIDQSCYDDPTWDGKGAQTCPKYTHFAMPNDCHDPRRNQKYDYYLPQIYKFSKMNAFKELEEWNPSIEYNNSKNQIDQLMIEKIYFNVLQKMDSDASEEEIYQVLSKMAMASFDEQTERMFMGNLEQKQLKLSKAKANQIYNSNKSEITETHEATL